MGFQPRPTNEVLLHEEAGEAFLLNVKTGEYFGLNRAGIIVWSALLHGIDPEQELARRWPDVPRDVLRQDVSRLLEALLQAGLVLDSDNPPGGA